MIKIELIIFFDSGDLETIKKGWFFFEIINKDLTRIYQQLWRCSLNDFYVKYVPPPDKYALPSWCENVHNKTRIQRRGKSNVQKISLQHGT